MFGGFGIQQFGETFFGENGASGNEVVEVVTRSETQMRVKQVDDYWNPANPTAHLNEERSVRLRRVFV